MAIKPAKRSLQQITILYYSLTIIFGQMVEFYTYGTICQIICIRTINFDFFWMSDVCAVGVLLHICFVHIYVYSLNLHKYMKICTES